MAGAQYVDDRIDMVRINFRGQKQKTTNINPLERNNFVATLSPKIDVYGCTPHLRLPWRLQACLLLVYICKNQAYKMWGRK